MAEALAAALQRLVTPTASTRAPAFPPPKFAGTAEESLDQWLMDIDEYATCVKWSESQKVSSLPLLLSGRAKQIYQDLPTAAKSSWPSVLLKLEETFGIDAATNILTFQKLDRVQGQYESVRDYSKDLIQRLRNAKITNDQHIMSCFFRGLLPNIKNQVIVMQPKSLSELEKFACIVELNISANGDSTAIAVQDAISQVTAAVTNRITHENSVPQSHTPQAQSTDSRRIRFRSQSPRDNDRNHVSYQHKPQQDQQYQRSPSPYPNYRTDPSHGGRQNPNNSNSYQTRQNVRSYSQPRPAYQNKQPSNQQSSRGPSQDTWPQRSGNPQPFCQQCNERHVWGQHTDPTCWKCSTRGHARSACPQGF